MILNLFKEEKKEPAKSLKLEGTVSYSRQTDIPEETLILSSSEYVPYTYIPRYALQNLRLE
jgi:hypothetical protein